MDIYWLNRPTLVSTLWSIRMPAYSNYGYYWLNEDSACIWTKLHSGRVQVANVNGMKRSRK